MADGYGNQIGYWRVHVAAWVTSYTDTTDTIHVEARWQSVAAGWDYSGWVAATVWVNGQQVGHTNNSGSKYINNSEVVVCSGDLTVPKTDNARNITCSASIAWNGFHPGTSNASCSVPVGGINYRKPNAPKSVSFTRASDMKATITWQSNYDNGALKPWKQILIASRKSTGGAAWGPWSDQQGGSGTVVLNWDASNYSFTNLQPNGRYQFAVYARNQAGDSAHVDSPVIYTTPAAPKSVSAVKTDSQQVTVTIDASNTYASKIIVERRVNSGSWSQLGEAKLGAGTATYIDGSVPGGTIEYRCLAQRYVYADSGSMLSGAYTQSNSVTTLTPPLAPTITSPITGAYPMEAMLKFAWTPNHPDGSAQTRVQVEVTPPAGSPVIETKPPITSYTRAFAFPGTYRIRVRTKGLHADWGAWSDYRSFTLAYPPSIAVTAPLSNGTITALPFDIAWSVADSSGVSQQTVELLSEGRVVWSRTPATAVRNVEVTSAGYMPKNGETLQIRVTVRGGSTLTSTESVMATVSYTPPAEPGVTVYFDESYAANIQVNFGTESDAPHPATIYSTIHRANNDGTMTEIVSNLQNGQYGIDRLPPLNQTIVYRVTAFAESGATQSVDVETVCESGFGVLNYGVDASTAIPLGYDLKVAHSRTHETSEFHFATGSDEALPVSYSVNRLNASLDIGCRFEWDADLYDRILRVASRYPYAWYREPSGIRMYAKIDQNVEVDTKNRKYIEYSASMTQLQWEEPVS